MLPVEKSAFHMHGDGGENNTKFISPDSHLEVVFDEEGNLVTDSINIGTYNYVGPDDYSGHSEYDMDPYFKRGNTEGMEGRGKDAEYFLAGEKIIRFESSDNAFERVYRN